MEVMGERRVQGPIALPPMQRESIACGISGAPIHRKNANRALIMGAGPLEPPSTAGGTGCGGSTTPLNATYATGRKPTRNDEGTSRGESRTREAPRDGGREGRRGSEGEGVRE